MKTKDFNFEFGHATFKFVDGKQIVWHDPFKETPKLYFYLMGNLKNIWKAVVIAIPYNEKINYPDTEQL